MALVVPRSPKLTHRAVKEQGDDTPSPADDAAQRMKGSLPLSTWALSSRVVIGGIQDGCSAADPQMDTAPGEEVKAGAHNNYITTT